MLDGVVLLVLMVLVLVQIVCVHRGAVSAGVPLQLTIITVC